ncbi:MAG: glycosyltransferase family 4 protein [Lachnospiraceae bacterium]|nr:glycosyltransferase family 4 protein [Lachnospiraceae bacterium]
MKVFVAGDYYSGTGPALVTAEYIEHMGKAAMCQRFKNKALRALELVIKVPFSSVILCSGHSKQNILAMKLGKLFGKKSAFLMHGCVEHENRINHREDSGMNRTERETMRLADMIIAVSEYFAGWLKENYPEYADKTGAVPNGIGLRAGKSPVLKDRDGNMILAVGGGMPRKRIVNVCRALAELRREEEYKDLYLTVIGDEGDDTALINGFDFVENKGIVSHEEAKRLMEKASLFVQNSCFETFGMAPLEALSHGCDLLISKETGAIGIFEGIDDRFIINDCENTDEIREKIRFMQNCHNNEILISSLNRENVSWESRTKELLQKLYSLKND